MHFLAAGPVAGCNTINRNPNRQSNRAHALHGADLKELDRSGLSRLRWLSGSLLPQGSRELQETFWEPHSGTRSHHTGRKTHVRWHARRGEQHFTRRLWRLGFRIWGAKVWALGWEGTAALGNARSADRLKGFEKTCSDDLLCVVDGL